MPELPDVEGFRRTFVRHAEGQRVERVHAPDTSVVRNTTPQGLGRATKRRRFGKPDRHGKWLLVPTDGGDGPTVVFHFGMTGYLWWAAPDERLHPHDRVVFVCPDGELRFNQMRKLGGVWLARDPSTVAEVTGDLGPDALGVSAGELAGSLSERRGGLKAALMDQSVLAGLGNLTVDEALWRARLHPATPAGELDDAAVGSLHRAIRDVLDRSVPAGRVPPRPDWLTGVRDDDNPRCPRCGTRLEDGRIAGRRTWWCPRCQPPPG